MIDTKPSDMARQILQESRQAQQRLDPSLSKRYGLVVLAGSILQMLLFLVSGVFLANDWSWATIFLFAGFAVALSFFWTRAEAHSRQLIPHGGRNLENFAKHWRNALSLAGIILLGATASKAGMPVALGTPNQGLGWAAIVACLLLATAAAPTVVFAVHLLKKGNHL
ncbi:hypothetical protein BW13_02540 [Bifidobacterium sp. UTCIF-37]|uniref:hypothetical protein n=1 Tax=unclassified Bifidobacterium TaxID=2608897 RepID=UPI00112C3AC4|nr:MULTISPECIES: hypothetical protein [unclassified Bifidobacterium]TPF86852.1 hypothetical protein BW13_02540 [Bifidobacterium sp. UTCIF-37]TPF90455.1 hypothetical protein BW11_02550 [Bifidobacterium sp. UTCIF-38]